MFDLRFLVLVCILGLSSQSVLAQGAQSGKQRANNIKQALQNPSAEAKDSAEVFKKKMQSGIGNPYQGGVVDPIEIQKIDMEFLLNPKGKDGLPNLKAEAEIRKCMSPAVVAERCCVSLEAGFSITPPKDMYAWHWPMIFTEVTENTYVSRYMSTDEVLEGCTTIRSQRVRNGADWAKKGLKRMNPNASTDKIKQSDVTQLLNQLDAINKGVRCNNEVNSSNDGRMTTHVVINRAGFSKEFQEKFEDKFGLQRGTFSKLRIVERNLISAKPTGIDAKPIGTDNWEGYEYTGDVDPDKVRELRNPRARPNITDPSVAYQMGGGKFADVVKKMMLTRETRSDAPKFFKDREYVQPEMPNYPGWMFSSALPGYAPQYNHWQAAWSMMVLAGLHPVHEPQTNSYPVFEVMDYMLSLQRPGRPPLGDKVFVLGNTKQEPGCYGGADPKESFKPVEQYGGEEGLEELYDVKTANEDAAYNMRRYAAFIGIQACPLPYVFDYGNPRCAAAAPHKDSVPFTYEYYGSGGKFIFY